MDVWMYHLCVQVVGTEYDTDRSRTPFHGYQLIAQSQVSTQYLNSHMDYSYDTQCCLSVVLLACVVSNTADTLQYFMHQQ
jgi:hypothetical protein